MIRNYKQPVTKVLWNRVQPGNIVYVEDVSTVNGNIAYRLIKRGFDITASLLGLLLLIVPGALLCIIIMLDSPGSPVYSQVRLGLNEKPFTLYKFRSMRIDAETDGARWAEDDDPRVTKIGRILRNTRLDELPQLINILAGQMSLVGPRPERPEFYDLFDTYIVGYRQRMKVLPGLTGYAQVMGGYTLDPEEKIILDMEYIENQSISMDIMCLLKTVGIVFNGDGAR